MKTLEDELKIVSGKIVEIEGYLKSIDFVGKPENKRKFQNFLNEVATISLRFTEIDVENFSYENKEFTQKATEEKIIIETFNSIYNAFCKNFEISVGGISLAVQEGVDGALSVVGTKGRLSQHEE